MQRPFVYESFVWNQQNPFPSADMREIILAFSQLALHFTVMICPVVLRIQLHFVFSVPWLEMNDSFRQQKVF